MTCIEMVTNFFKEEIRNKWLYADDMEVYVRKATRSILGESLSSLDIANISVYKPEQGVFTRFIQDVIWICPWDIIYVENILNSILLHCLRKHGFKLHDPVCPPSMYKVNCMRAHYYVCARGNEVRWSSAVLGPNMAAMECFGTKEGVTVIDAGTSNPITSQNIQAFLRELAVKHRDLTGYELNIKE